MPFVFSTQSQSNAYVDWLPSPDGQPARKGMRVVIKGGANVVDRRALDTPRGVVTEVTDEEAAFLENHPSFKIHMQRGFVTIERKQPKVEKVVADMAGKDGGAQKTASDFAGSKAKPTTLDAIDPDPHTEI